MIFTGSHKDFNETNDMTVAISGNGGSDANFKGATYKKLAPKLYFWKKWHDSINILDEYENNQYYVNEYFKSVLMNLNPEEVHNELNDKILLCYEESEEFCHRHIVAFWLEILLGINVCELKKENNEIVKVDRPEYIKELLIDSMKSNLDMKNYHSLRALYLYEKSERMLSNSKELEQNGKNSESLKTLAIQIKYEADIEEMNYLRKNEKVLKKN